MGSFSSKPNIKEEYWLKMKEGGEIEKKYISLGDYKTKKQTIEIEDKKAEKYIITYPEKLETLTEKWPMIIIVNGSNDPTSIHYNFNVHLSSHGFIVVGNEDKGSGSGLSTSQMLDYMLKLNEDNSHVLYQKINVEKIGIIGGSQGAAGAIKAVTEFNNGKYYKTIVTLSLPRIEMAKNFNWNYDVSKIYIPWFQITSTGFADDNRFNPISPLSSLKENYENLNDGVPCVIARRKDIDHTDMLVFSDGYITAWFCYMLKNDKYAAKAFAGNNPEILINNLNWQDVKIKNIN